MQGLWRRQLDHYPDTRPRMTYLAIVVLATIVLYYEFYIAGAVSPSIIAQYGMTFNYYVYIIVVANAVGAFGSLAAGLADRWGRANLVAYGLLITGILVAFGIPNASSKLSYAILFAAVGLVEGVILVATPALVRDFSPQLGRASAMGSGRSDRSSAASWWPSCQATRSATCPPGRTSSPSRESPRSLSA